MLTCPIGESTEGTHKAGRDLAVALTDLLIEMYVANPGTSTFGMFQNKYLDHKGDPTDAGWGDQNFIPTVGSWFIHSNEKVTADHVRFGIGAGKFEFYLGGIEQGVVVDKIVSDVSYLS